MACRVSDFTKLPTFKIEINQITYSIPPEYYLQKCYNKNDGTYACQTLIETVQGSGYLFFGAVFFSRYYALFDTEGRRIGLARSKEVKQLADVFA